MSTTPPSITREISAIQTEPPKLIRQKAYLPSPENSPTPSPPDSPPYLYLLPTNQIEDPPQISPISLNIQRELQEEDQKTQEIFQKKNKGIPCLIRPYEKLIQESLIKKFGPSVSFLKNNIVLTKHPLSNKRTWAFQFTYHNKKFSTGVSLYDGGFKEIIDNLNRTASFLELMGKEKWCRIYYNQFFHIRLS